MSTEKLVVTIGGLILAGFIYWFFLLKKEKRIAVADSVDIVVSGGYTPNVITVKKGKSVQLHFIRKDPSSCLDEVILPDFHLSPHEWCFPQRPYTLTLFFGPI
jgi:plastocyanin domain-containing protein